MAEKRRNPELLLAGEVGKPHGILGEVYLMPISDDPQRFEPGNRLTHADGRSLVVEAARQHRDRLLVKFEGIDSRSDAETLRGPVYVSASQLRALGDDEFWEHELIGCRVVSPTGEELGSVAAVVPGPAQDLLAVTTVAGERLVPLVADIVTRVDPREQTVVVDAPAGLLE